MFFSVRNNKNSTNEMLKYIHSVVVYQKHLTQLGEMIIFSPRLENYQFSQPLSVFLIYGNTMYLFSITTLKKERFENMGKGENAGNQHVSQNFYCPSKTNINFSMTYFVVCKYFHF